VFEPFMRQWNGRTVAELFEHVSRSMPADDRGSLTPRAYGDVVAFVLESNGVPGGVVGSAGEARRAGGDHNRTTAAVREPWAD
jgi:hypothetical protein